MKTTRILLLAAAFLLHSWPSFSQQESPAKIVITKRTVDADGSENTETIVKKGDAAKNFDVEQYIKANRAAGTEIDITVSGADEERSIVVKGPKLQPEKPKNAPAKPYLGYSGYQSGADTKPFLGVEEDSDENPNQPGLVVEVVRGSAADRAGLRHNDKITRLNGQPIDRWADLTAFMKTVSAGDKVEIAYERNGKPAKATATLTARSEVKTPKAEPRGYLGVTDEGIQGGGARVGVNAGSAAAKSGMKSGDVILRLADTPVSDFEDISDFMAYAKPGENLEVVYERNGKRATAQVVLGSSASADWSASDDWGKINNNISDNSWDNQGDCTVAVRQKDACLGVYTDPYEQGETKGARISGFTAGSAAKEAGFSEGDVITSINGKAVADADMLWDEIAKQNVGDKVTIDYLRDGQKMRTKVGLKACQNNSSRVEVLDEAGEQVRNFLSWNWKEEDQRRLSERSVITIRKGEGDAPSPETTARPTEPERSLQLDRFRAYPNPTMGQVTVEFSAPPVATTVTFFDLSGRQVFREELNAFNGRYHQEFDLSEYAKGTIIIRVQQGEKVFSDQLVVN